MKVPLPIDAHLAPLIEALRRPARSAVLVAEPGAGKTTRVPPALLAAPGLLDAAHPNVVMLQPRRIAARASAARIASENNWTIGREVGWHVRFDKRTGPGTRLRVLTEGILVRQIVDDPSLQGIGAVILDEFHERSIYSDVAIALLNEIKQSIRPDLVIIVMSATLDAAPVAKFLGGCPIISVAGRTFPIEVEHALAPSGERIEARVARAVEGAVSGGAGDILVFLPGAREINDSAAALSRFARDDGLAIMPLHGSLPPEEQQRVLEPGERRKLILATNIAETSLTIPGVRMVIDSGLARVAAFDPDRGLDRLDLSRISKASATQRAGRAGREAPGKCIRLYTAREFHAFPEFEVPEIRRVDLSSTLLSLHAWGIPDPRKFGWYDVPEEERISSAERLLYDIGAIDAAVGGRVTELGRRMSIMPVHPRLARLLVAGADFDIAEQAATMAALLSERDAAAPSDGSAYRDRGPSTRGTNDLAVRFGALRSTAQGMRLKDELLRSTRGSGVNSRAGQRLSEDEAMRRALLLAFPDRVCRRRTESDPAAGVMVGGAGGVRLAPESIVRDHEFFLALDARRDDRSANREALVRSACAIDPSWLEELFPSAIRRQREVVFDERRRRVVGRGRVYYDDLVLREDADAPLDPQQAGPVLAAALKPAAKRLIGANEDAASFLARVELLRAAMPEQEWPTFHQQEFEAIVEEMCQNKRSIEEFERTSPLPFLSSRLRYPLDRLLAAEAPLAIVVPTGNSIKLQYPSGGGAPVLAVRLQEMFGMSQTPRIAAGRVAVVLHLLGPNYRPVQITDDLRSFWATTYFQVRKDLRVRYPKHAWPDDPLTAPPQAKGRSHR